MNVPIYLNGPRLTFESFFEEQEGDFKLTVLSIAAATKKESSLAPEGANTEAYGHPADDTSESIKSFGQDPEKTQNSSRRSIWHWLIGRCGKL